MAPDDVLADALIFGITPEGGDDMARSVRRRLGGGTEVETYVYPDGRSLLLCRPDDCFGDEDRVVFRSGFIRSWSRERLSASQLARRGLVGPRGVEAEELTGNGVVGAISTTEPAFSVWATPTAVREIFRVPWRDGILCSTDLRALLLLLDEVELDELAAPGHFALASATGSRTFFRNVSRIEGGEQWLWTPGGLERRRAAGLNFDDEWSVGEVNEATTDRMYQELSGVMQTYVDELDSERRRVAVALSGGVDSSLVQLLVNNCLPEGSERLSFSYRADAPSFAFEIDNAADASRLLGTHHFFCPFTRGEMIPLLEETVERVVQPAFSSELLPAMSRVAVVMLEEAGPGGLLIGESADIQFGLLLVKKLLLRDRFRSLPGSAALFATAGAALMPFAPSKGDGLRQVGSLMRASRGRGHLYEQPTHGVTKLDVVEACRVFGEKVVDGLLEERVAQLDRLLVSESEWERIHLVDMLCASRFSAANQVRLFASAGQLVAPFYLDLEVIRLARQFHPSVRFHRGMMTKPIPRMILQRHGLGAITRRKKGKSVFPLDTRSWMRDGPMRDRMEAIERPDFLSRGDFQRHLADPGGFAWSLLIWDIFQQKVVRPLRTSLG